MRIPFKTSSILVIVACLVACGGVNDIQPVSVAPAPAPAPAPPPTLSTSQQAFERVFVGPDAGSYFIAYNLNRTGPQVLGSNYIQGSAGKLSASPLTNGPQVSTQSAAENLSSTLGLATSNSPNRSLKDGVILVQPNTFAGSKSRYSYSGVNVLQEALAADGTTVAFTLLRFDYGFTPLSGLLTNSPEEVKQSLQSLFINSASINSAAGYATGAGYTTFKAKYKGDYYGVFDCNAATTDANVSPCFTGTTLAAELTAGINSARDGRTYLLADGATTTISGVPVWVASAAQPYSATRSPTPTYTIYFQLNGNVYTGAVVRDGAVVGGSSYTTSAPGVSPVTFGNVANTVRLNKAAVNSIKAGVTF